MKIHATERVFDPEPVTVPVNNLNYGLFLDSLDRSINNRGVGRISQIANSGDTAY